MLNPGTVIGPDTNIYPTSCVRGCIPAGSIYKKQGEIAKKVLDFLVLYAKIYSGLLKYLYILKEFSHDLFKEKLKKCVLLLRC